jgi:hypothetical protein
MEAKIKRMAQLMFDNAKYLSDELTKGDVYRYFDIQFQAHNATGTMDICIWMGAEGKVIDFLTNDFAEIDTIKRKWIDVNEALSVSPLPKPIETRENL